MIFSMNESTLRVLPTLGLATPRTEKVELSPLLYAFTGFLGFALSRYDTPKNVFNMPMMFFRGLFVSSLLSTPLALMNNQWKNEAGELSSHQAGSRCFQDILISLGVTLTALTYVSIFKNKSPQDVMIRGGLLSLGLPVLGFVLTELFKSN